MPVAVGHPVKRGKKFRPADIIAHYPRRPEPDPPDVRADKDRQIAEFLSRRGATISPPPKRPAVK